jgi:raffinose/stachyose/melibiose transport system substrate-binding protein
MRQKTEEGFDMLKGSITTWTAAALLLAAASSRQARAAELSIESWRNDDLAIWQDKILPVFMKEHPDIKVTFTPTESTKYNSALDAKLDAGTAGDLITCRPFDAGLALYQKKHLESLNDLPGMQNFGALAKLPFSTDDAKTTFCVPMASVIHGFIYNKDIFTKLGLQPPQTVDQFFAVLDAIKKDGNYTPLAMGTQEQWESANLAYQNIGPTYWHGEEGRLGIVNGTQKLTDPGWVEPFRVLARWRPYLGDGFQAQSYSDSQNLFELGRAAIYPAGSWDIGIFAAQVNFPMGAFPPPAEKAGDACYVNDHPDIGMGINPKTKDPAAARTFLEWVASPEFASLYANSLVGFFTLSNVPVKLENPVAQEFESWRTRCKTTMRPTYQFVSRGTPNIENQQWVESANVINGTDTPDQAAKKMQDGLASWYPPQQKK